VVGLAWGFGAHRVRQALKEMLGFYPAPIMTVFWKYTAPLVTAVLFVFCLVKYKPIKYPNGEEYPLWAELFGFSLSACSMIVIPAYALYYLFCQNTDLPLSQRFWKGVHPPADLGVTGAGRPAYSAEEEMEFIDSEKKARNNNYK
jgi:hypothetical protein